MITLPQLCHVLVQVIGDSSEIQADISAKQSMRALVAISVSDRGSRGTERPATPSKVPCAAGSHQPVARRHGRAPHALMTL